jgi:hypothetical protein
MDCLNRHFYQLVFWFWKNLFWSWLPKIWSFNLNSLWCNHGKRSSPILSLIWYYQKSVCDISLTLHDAGAYWFKSQSDCNERINPNIDCVFRLKLNNQSLKCLYNTLCNSTTIAISSYRIDQFYKSPYYQLNLQGRRNKRVYITWFFSQVKERRAVFSWEPKTALFCFIKSTST